MAGTKVINSNIANITVYSGIRGFTTRWMSISAIADAVIKTEATGGET